MSREEHITYDDKLTGIVFIPKKNVFKKTKIDVRYSKSNVADSISFSDNKNFMVQFYVDSLKKLLEKYEEEE